MNYPKRIYPGEQETVLAEKLHKWYLEATQKLNPEDYNPKAQKPFKELTEEQKFIDRYIANAIRKHYEPNTKESEG